MLGIGLSRSRKLWASDRGVIRTGKRNAKHKGRLHSIIPKGAKGTSTLKNVGKVGKNIRTWYVKEFDVCLQALDKRFKRLGSSRKKTVTDSKKREAYLKRIGQIPEGNRVRIR